MPYDSIVHAQPEYPHPDVSKHLGHARPSITLDIYGYPIPSMQGQVAEVMDEMITPIILEDLHPIALGSDCSRKSRKKPPHI